MSYEFEIRNPISRSEYNESVNVAFEIFKNSKKRSNFTKYFVEKNYKNIFIVLNKKSNKVIGFAFYVIRELTIYKIKTKIAFISSICILKKYRKIGLSLQLINKCNEELQKQNVIFSAVIASRKLDYFYNKLNFWGVSSFPQVCLSAKFFTKSEHNIKNSIGINNKDIININKIYSKVYLKINGYFKRNNNYWNFIINKCNLEKLFFIKFTIRKKLIGYAIFDKENIYEMATLDQKYYQEILNLIFLKIRNNKVNFQTNYYHQINKYLTDFDTCYSFRKINFGGHLIKIINKELFLYIFKNKISNFNFRNKSQKEIIEKFFNSEIINDKIKYTKSPKFFYINYLDQI